MSMVDFTLVLDGKSFPIAKQKLISFFELNPRVFDESAYRVRSQVSIEEFGDFVKYLESKQLPTITPGNAKYFHLLSEEFGIFELSSLSGEFVSDPQLVDSHLTSVSTGLHAKYLSQLTEFESFRRDFPLCLSNSLFSRVDQLESEIAQFCSDIENRLKLCSSNCEELRCTIPQEVSNLESRLSFDLSSLKSACDEFRSDIDELTIIPRLFPLYPDAPLNGIICELTRKHCGNVHDKGIVLMTSKSVSKGEVKNLVELASRSDFHSNDESGQWTMWEFRDSLIRPTHYTIRSSKDNYPKSWSVEGSMDGECWTELDRRKNDSHLKEDLAVHSFEVRSPFECQFVRLTQTGKNHNDSHILAFCSLEIFGGLEQSFHGRFPLRKPNSLEGVISYLTRKHGGNVHDKGIVTITSKSDKYDDVRKVADLTSDWGFMSKNEPGQWVCWDFRELRVRPTHYTIRGSHMKSWVVESSLDGEAWTEIDRKTDNQDFKKFTMASFAVSERAECRFIRLTPTDKNHLGNDYQTIDAFEIFGTLLE
jgi:hypothetical protein